MIWTGIRKGDSHKNYCEDSLFVLEFDSLIIGGVFDGCSSGIRSHLASGLLSTCFKNAFDNWYPYVRDFFKYLDVITHKELLTPINDAIKTFKAAVAVLNFKEMECLSTALIFIYNPYKKVLVVYSFGDGSIYINNVMINIISPNNAPDYLVYNFKDLDNYIEKNTAVYKDVEKFSICTDGIEAIRLIKQTEINPIDYLLDDLSLHHSHAMLDRKLNIISNTHRYEDDISIIRYENI